MPIEDLRSNEMMNHLLDALDRGQDIGHYGRLVFAMIARHFLSDDELKQWLCKDPDCDETKALVLIEQVKGRDYSPPRREKIQQYQREQDFPICPGGDDPDACNVYRNLKFPDEVYEHIEQYRREKVEAAR